MELKPIMNFCFIYKPRPMSQVICVTVPDLSALHFPTVKIN